MVSSITQYQYISAISSCLCR